MEQKKATKLRMQDWANAPDPDLEESDPPDELTPPWEPQPATAEPTRPISEPVEPQPDIAKILKEMQRTIEKQQHEISKLKAANPATANRITQAEIAKLAQARLDKQMARDKVGKYEWRVQIHGMRQPIVMHIDSQDRETAIAKLYAKRGVQFNAKKMDMRLVG